MNLKAVLSVTLIFVVFHQTSCIKQKEVLCPEFCLCDEYHTFRRATCQHRNLYSIEINMPEVVQILDLSFNQISELGNNIFLDTRLTGLLLLNISHNKVSQIHLNGFAGLTNLKTLDLSFNAIRYFMKSWFHSLESLEELYLRGNNLKSISEEPVMGLPNLKILDLSNCGINHIKPHVFTKLPNLTTLNISENFMTHINTEVLKPLKMLRHLDVRNNNFDCVNMHLLHKLHKYVKHKHINIEDSCQKNTKVKKFEKMIMLTDKTDEAVDKKNSWIVTENSEVDLLKLCNESFGNRTFADESTTKDEGLLMEIIKLNPWLVVAGILVYGIIIGLIIGCSVEIKPKKTYIPESPMDFLPDGSSNLRSINMSSSTDVVRTDDFSSFRPRTRSLGSGRFSRVKRNNKDALLVSEVDLADSTPVQARKVYL